MAIRDIWIEGYRSIRRIRLPLGRVTVVVGPNGCGKSNLYQSLVLLANSARGRLAGAIAAEGGMASVLWAGPRRKGPVRIKLGVALDDWTYELTCGLPKPGPVYPPDAGPKALAAQTACGLGFPMDPAVKSEKVTHARGRRKTVFLERNEGSVTVRGHDGERRTYPVPLWGSESALSQIRDPERYPELTALEQELLRWRFYDHFRTDPDSPIRQPHVVARTPALDADGGNLAATLQTAVALGRLDDLAHAVDKAFPGAVLEFVELGEAQFEVGLRMPGIGRAFKARELSDGTLRYLCLLGVLVSARPPALIALNEPETSIHPDLLEPLGRLIVAASRESQVWLTTHSRVLADCVAGESGCRPVELEMADGETRVVGQGLLER